MSRAEPFDLEKAQVTIAEGIDASDNGPRLMKTLCHDVGPRPTGSVALRKGGEVLASEWQKLGAVDIHTEAVPVVAWDEGESRLETCAPHQRLYDSVQCVHSGSGKVEARLLNAGSGSLEDTDKVERRRYMRPSC